jgi:hypothetical protein
VQTHRQGFTRRDGANFVDLKIQNGVKLTEKAKQINNFKFNILCGYLIHLLDEKW